MTEGDLRAKVRELIASGVLPGAPPVIEGAGRGTEGDRARMVVDTQGRSPAQSAANRVQRSPTSGLGA